MTLIEKALQKSMPEIKGEKTVNQIKEECEVAIGYVVGKITLIQLGWALDMKKPAGSHSWAMAALKRGFDAGVLDIRIK